MQSQFHTTLVELPDWKKQHRPERKDNAERSLTTSVGRFGWIKLNQNKIQARYWVCGLHTIWQAKQLSGFQNISYVTDFSPTVSWREWLTNGKNSGMSNSKKNCHCWTLVFRTRQNYVNIQSRSEGTQFKSLLDVHRDWEQSGISGHFNLTVWKTSSFPQHQYAPASHSTACSLNEEAEGLTILKPTAIYGVFCLLMKGDICQANTPSTAIRYTD